MHVVADRGEKPVVDGRVGVELVDRRGEGTHLVADRGDRRLPEYVEDASHAITQANQIALVRQHVEIDHRIVKGVG
jgi:hypothetical protein